MRTSLIILGSLQMILFFENHSAVISFKKCDAAFIHRKSNGIVPDSLPHEAVRYDFKRFYDEYGLEGMFVLYDSRKKESTFYNKELFKQASTPASTFNILFTLIGLQEGIIKDENSTINPGGASQDPGYNKNLALKAAFAENYESFFREMIKQISTERIRYWLAKINYGNKNIEDHPGDFWLGTSLQITPQEQLDFVRKFYYEDWSFSKQYYHLVKKLMLDKVSRNYKIFGKRGSYKIISQNKYIGWYIGYIETSNDTYFFVNFIQSSNLNHRRLVDAQKNIPYKIFQLLRITPDK